MFTTLSNLSWADLVDILFLCVVGYHLVIWFKGTKAFRALIGLVALAAIYSLAQAWGLFLTTWVFQVLWQVLVILILILFQKEIRQVLERINPLRPFSRSGIAGHKTSLEIIGRMARQASERGWGALVVITRRDPIPSLPGEGLPVGAKLSLELLLSIFNPSSPTHDGAVIIDNNTIERTGTILPLSALQNLPSHFGTRHRAALGITEACDAVAVIVSEESGRIGLVEDGAITDLGAGEDLENRLGELLNPVPEDKPGPWRRFSQAVIRNWQIKLAVVILVSLTWAVMAGQQNYEVSITTPITYTGLRDGVTLSELSDKEVVLKVKGPRRQASSLTRDNVKVVVNLSGYRQGTHQIGLIRQDIQVPLGLEVGGINPRVVVVTLAPEKIK